MCHTFLGGSIGVEESGIGKFDFENVWSEFLVTSGEVNGFVETGCVTEFVEMKLQLLQIQSLLLLQEIQMALLHDPT